MRTTLPLSSLGSDSYRDIAVEVKNLQAVPVCRVDRNGTNQDFASDTASSDVVAFNHVTYDTHGWFDVSTYKYTPKQTGYYRVSLVVTFTSTAFGNDNLYASIRKNGAEVSKGFTYAASIADALGPVSVSDVIFLNGGADYIDFYTTHAACTAGKIAGAANKTWAAIDFICSDQVR